jgi:hypothetical protein
MWQCIGEAMKRKPEPKLVCNGVIKACAKTRCPHQLIHHRHKPFQNGEFDDGHSCTVATMCERGGTYKNVKCVPVKEAK